MKITDILSSISKEELAFLSCKTKVDTQVKKLEGHIVFKLILMSMLESNKVSLRVMESMIKSAKFKYIANIEDNFDTRHSSIRDRISTINFVFFEQIFEHLFKKYNKELNELKGLTKVDSTYIGLSKKLISFGMLNGSSKEKERLKKNIKYSVCLKGSLPCKVSIFTEQSYISENLALPETILSNQFCDQSIMVIDRGLASRKAFETFDDKRILFIVRSSKVSKPKVKEEYILPEKDTNSSVEIISDQLVYLKDMQNKYTEKPYRYLVGKIIKTNELIYWITNVKELNPYEIANLYKQRWEIEIFFKFLKQHLNLNHLVVRNENGIKVMLYMTLILAILIIVYKKNNKTSSYKIAKLNIEIELDNEIIKEIVILCGGDPNKTAYLWNSS